MASHRLSRRNVLVAAGAGAVTLGFPNILRGQTREFVIGGPGGQEKVTRQFMIPPFEKKYNCKVLYEGGGSLPHLVKVQASPSSPPYDVVMMDETILILAEQEGLLEPVKLEQVPNMADISRESVMRDGAWLTYYVPAIAIGYNTDELPNGFDSWEGLWDPSLQDRVLIPHPKTTQAAAVIAIAAQLETGKPIAEAQYDLDAAFRKLVKIKPNLFQSYISSSQASVLIEQGEAWAAAGFFTTNTLPRKAAGAPIDLARPAEGSFQMPKGIGKVRNAAAPDLAEAWINACLSPEYQKIWMREFLGAPTNVKVETDPGLIPQSELIPLDWDFYTGKLNELSDRFDREITG